MQNLIPNQICWNDVILKHIFDHFLELCILAIFGCGTSGNCADGTPPDGCRVGCVTCIITCWAREVKNCDRKFQIRGQDRPPPLASIWTFETFITYAMPQLHLKAIVCTHQHWGTRFQIWPRGPISEALVAASFLGRPLSLSFMQVCITHIMVDYYTPVRGIMGLMSPRGWHQIHEPQGWGVIIT